MTKRCDDRSDLVDVAHHLSNPKGRKKNHNGVSSWRARLLACVVNDNGQVFGHFSPKRNAPNDVPKTYYVGLRQVWDTVATKPQLLALAFLASETRYIPFFVPRFLASIKV